jgi:hypothetical protein
MWCFQISWVVRGQNPIEGDIFGGFKAYAKAFEDSRLAFGLNQLSEGSGFIDVPCVGQVLCTVLEGVPDLFSILLDLSEKSIGFLHLRFGLDDSPCAVHERRVGASIEEVGKVPFGGDYGAASVGEEW